MQDHSSFVRLFALLPALILVGCVGGAGNVVQPRDATVAIDQIAADVAGGMDVPVAPPDGAVDVPVSGGTDAAPGDAAVSLDAKTGDSVSSDAQAGDGAIGTDFAVDRDAATATDAKPGTDGRTTDAALDTQIDAVAPSDTRDAGVAVDARDATTSTPDAGPLTSVPWPGANMVVTADGDNAFGTDLSGLAYQPTAGTAPAILWAVNNNSAKLYRLAWGASTFASVTTDGWKSGKKMKYPTGDGTPDSEGVTLAELNSTAIYVVAERDGDNNDTSRLSILRYDTAGTATTLTATHEWNLTADLPKVDANKGLEGIAWIPDTALVAKGFFDENLKKAYAPADYVNHGTGLFFVGLETGGQIYGYALDHTARTFKRVATVASGQDAVMDLSYDRDVGTLWAACDDTCDNQTMLLDVDTNAASPTHGRFRVRRGFARPSTLPNEGNEGIAIAPESECMAGKKPFFWADDSNTDDHAIRRDSIPCGVLY
jgi:hypothetical protein